VDEHPELPAILMWTTFEYKAFDQFWPIPRHDLEADSSGDEDPKTLVPRGMTPLWFCMYEMYTYIYVYKQ